MSAADFVGGQLAAVALFRDEVDDVHGNARVASDAGSRLAIVTLCRIPTATMPVTIARSLSRAVSAVATTSSPLVVCGTSGEQTLVIVDRPSTRRPAWAATIDFRHGRHADGVAAEVAQHADFGPRFVGRAEHGDVHAAVADEIVLPGDGQRAVAQPAVVRGRHIGKPRAEPVVVHADERIAIQQVDVVVDDHDVAGGEVRIQSAGGVGDDQQLDAERLHHADRKRGPLGRVAFVAMEAALHGDDRHAAEPAAQQPAAMADGGRSQEMRHVAVVDRRFDLDRVADRAQAGTENDARTRRAVPAAADEAAVRRFVAR